MLATKFLWRLAVVTMIAIGSSLIGVVTGVILRAWMHL
jgi:hypothetical protein